MSAEVLTKRAKALKILGDLFISKGGSLAAGLGDVRSRLHSQMNGSNSDAASKAEGAEGAEGAAEGAGAEGSNSASNSTTASAEKAAGMCLIIFFLPLLL